MRNILVTILQGVVVILAIPLFIGYFVCWIFESSYYLIKGV